MVNHKRPGPSIRFREESFAEFLELERLRETRTIPYPQSSDLLRRTFQALLERLDRANSKDAQLVRMYLRNLTALEVFLTRYSVADMGKTNWEVLQRSIKFHLQSIANSRQKGKLQHIRPIISKQANWLGIYFSYHPLPRLDRLRNEHSWALWLRDHVPSMIELVSNFPCSCGYSDNLKELTDTVISSAKTNYRCSPAKFIRLLLAHLHNSKPAGIDRYLKPLPSN